MGILARPGGKASHRLLAGVALCLLTLAGVQAMAAPSKHQQVADLRYGESLFYYYSGNYPAALSRLMVAETQGGILHHDHYPPLMAAGMQLAFGMPAAAGDAFRHLLGQGEPPVVRDTAHFYLAKLHYTEGDYAHARQHLQQVGDQLAPRLADEAALLRVHLALHTGASPETARQQLPLSASRALALLNMGHAASRKREGEKARRYYRELLTLPPTQEQSDEVYLALRDKALTALGYSFLGEADYRRARAAFQQVRRDTALANPALLGYGWAAANEGDYTLAVRPWQLLRQRSLQSPEVLQTLVALPWAYEKLGAAGEALASYREAEALLTQEYEQTGQRLEQLDAATLIELLSGEGQSAWLSSAGGHAHWLTLDSTQLLLSSRDHLQRLLGRGDFQADTQALQDLLTLNNHLIQWQNKLAIYRDMLLAKEARRDKLHDDSRLGENHREQLAAWQQLSRQLDTIRGRRDAMALADADTRSLYQRSQHASEHLHLLNDAGRDLSTEADKLRLLEGILQWRGAQAFPDNLWRAEKALAQTHATLSASGEIQQRIEQRLESGSDIAAQVARLEVLAKRNQGELAALNTAINQQAQHLADRLATALQEHRQQLQDYLAQTRLQIARLYQQASEETTP